MLLSSTVISFFSSTSRVWNSVFPLSDPPSFLFLFFFLLWDSFSGLERHFSSLRPENHNISGLGECFSSSRPGWLLFSLLFPSFRPLLGSGTAFFLSQTRPASFFSSFFSFGIVFRVWNDIFPLSDPKITIFRVWENVFPLPDPHGKGTTPFPTILIPNRSIRAPSLKIFRIK